MPLTDNTPSTTVKFPDFPWKIEQEKMSKDRFIQECAIILYGNIDFNNSKIPVEVSAIDCVTKAEILAKAFFK